MRKTQPMFSLDQALADGDALAADDTKRLHAGLLLNGVLETSDRAGRDIAVRRLEGLSWGEIAIELVTLPGFGSAKVSSTLERH